MINGWWPTTGYSKRAESRINPPWMTTNEDEYDMNMDSDMVIELRDSEEMELSDCRDPMIIS